ncbi:MAG: hypothetical protein KKA55_14275 [Proteobacteria bacterium]|nr:hypothetical protein [Pseudomonadota bacterium]MBU1596687.1 hypothetical protein [Pseudomonadota bacterium]
MDIQTLSTIMGNQAAAASGMAGFAPAQATQPEGAGKPDGDSVNISEAARAKAASAPAASDSDASSAAQSTADTLARRIAKLQKELQREQGSDLSAEEKSGHLTTLRSQIRQLQNQQKNSSGDAATAFKIKHV